MPYDQLCPSILPYLGIISSEQLTAMNKKYELWLSKKRKKNYFLNLFTNSTLTTLSLFESKLVCSVHQRVDIGRIYSSLAQNLEFDWSIHITRKRQAAGKPDLFEQAQIFSGATTPKPIKYFSCYFFHSCNK